MRVSRGWLGGGRGAVVVVVVLRELGGLAWVGGKERKRGRSRRVEGGSMVLGLAVGGQAWVEGGIRALRWVKSGVKLSPGC